MNTSSTHCDIKSKLSSRVWRGVTVALIMLALLGGYLVGNLRSSAKLQSIVQEGSKTVYDMDGVSSSLAENPHSEDFIHSKNHIESLFAMIANTGAAEEQDRLIKLTDSLSTRDSLPLAIKMLLESENAGVIRASQQIITRLADPATVQSLLDSYDSHPSARLRDLLSQTMAAITSADAMPAMIEVVGDMNTSVLDQMVDAAAQALARNGSISAVDSLLERIQNDPTTEGRAILTSLVATLSNPISEEVLRETAIGSNKLASSSDARAAAVSGLANLPSPDSRILIKSFLHDSDPRVADLAAYLLRGQVAQ